MMKSMAMSRESVPCGCQQPPKETLKASGIVQRARVSAERAATCSVSASKHRLGDLGELAVARALLEGARRAHRRAAARLPSVADAAVRRRVELLRRLVRLRVAELEKRAIGAEERLEALRTAFTLYAKQSRQQTNALVAALDQLVAERGGSLE